MKKTKIVCTLGPATDNQTVLKNMVLAGMNVARINMSHGTHEEQLKRIDMIKELRHDMNVPLALLLDSKGPEVRIKTFKGDGAVLKNGDKFILTTEDVEGDDTRVGITYPNLYKHLENGNMILADDGKIELRVESLSKTEIITTVIEGGTLTNRKSLNFPNIEIDMEYLSDADKLDIEFAAQNDADMIALSFVRKAQDVFDAREYLKEVGGKDIMLISKIENRQGVKNMQEIIAASDGIMVARGDMGVEIPYEELPAIQKKLIKSCYRAGKVVITATQMLESMIKNARPTRAEISDVANAVYDGTSATMLSGETAIGKFPVQTVKTMTRIIRETERNINYKKRFYEHEEKDFRIVDAVSHCATMAAHDLNAGAIVAVTKSGAAARNISRFRPLVPIVGATTSKKAYHQLALSWGIEPVHAGEMIDNTDELIAHAARCAGLTPLVKRGDTIIIVAGVPVGISGQTNLMKVHTIE